LLTVRLQARRFLHLTAQQSSQDDRAFAKADQLSQTPDPAYAYKQLPIYDYLFDLQERIKRMYPDEISHAFDH
jgi:hypothetical protein